MATVPVTPLVVSQAGVTSLPSGVSSAEDRPSSSWVTMEQTELQQLIRNTEEHISARPDSVLLGTVMDRRLRVRKAIPLAVSVEEDQVIVSWDDTNEFAYGASTGDAIEEFSKLVGELYFDLNDQSIPLGKDLARVRDILNEYIEKVR